jgi:hypothetical protein
MEHLRAAKPIPPAIFTVWPPHCLFSDDPHQPDDLYDPLEGRWMWRNSCGIGAGLSVIRLLTFWQDAKDLVSDRYPSADAVMRDYGWPCRAPLPPSSVGRSTTHPIHPTQPPALHQGAAQLLVDPSLPVQLGQIPLTFPRNLLLVGRGGAVCILWSIRAAGYGGGHQSQWRTLASGGLDDCIRLWSLTTGELLQTLTGHTNH